MRLRKLKCRCEDPNPIHQADADRARALQEIQADAQTGGDKCGAKERDPEHVPWNPPWYQVRLAPVPEP
jgi:hypothetical protein